MERQGHKEGAIWGLWPLMISSLAGAVSYRTDPVAMSAWAAVSAVSGLALLLPPIRGGRQIVRFVAIAGVTSSAVSLVTALFQGSKGQLVLALTLTAAYFLLGYCLTTPRGEEAAHKIKRGPGAKHPMIALVLIVSVGAVLGGGLAFIWWRASVGKPSEAMKQPEALHPPVPPPVAVGDAQLTERQIRIAEEHNRLLEAQFQPIFRFVQGRRSVGSETFDFLEVWNDGAPIESYELWQASYIQINRMVRADGKIPGGWETRYLPAYYFIRRDYQGDARTGLLATLYAWRDPRGSFPGVNLTKEYERLEHEVRTSHNLGYTIAKRVFLQISYVDRSEVHRMVTYDIFPTSASFGPAVPRRRDNLLLSMPLPQQIERFTAKTLLAEWDHRGYILTDIGDH